MRCLSGLLIAVIASTVYIKLLEKEIFFRLTKDRR